VEKRAMRASQLPTARQPDTTSTDAATAADAAQGAAGPLVLGRYRLISRIGAGAFGTVWQARDQRLDRDVAVKLLPRERIIGGRFEREAKAAARLSHPGIVTLYEAAVDDDGAYLVSELVRGGTLAQLLERGRLSDRDVLGIGIALCEALDHAHAAGVVHRDVKPSNILIPNRARSSAQRAKLTDFGVARVVGGDTLTRTGDVIGTMAYMAPEQAEGREAEAAADLYSTALVIYEALTGVNPVLTGTVAVRARRLGAHLPPLRRQRRELPRELGHGIDLALRPRPRERGTLDELRHALIESLQVVDDQPGVVEAPWRPKLSSSEHLPEGSVPAPLAPARASSRWVAAAGTGWAARALAAAVVAGLAAWAAAHPLAPVPMAPSVLALVVALAIAALPRLGWLAVIFAGTALAAARGHPGLAVVIAAGGLVPVALIPRSGTCWPLPVACPGLGAIALAGAWPALAARAATTWRRTALGAIGWLWLIIATALVGHGLYLRRLPGVGAGTVWMSSPGAAVDHLLIPVLSSGVLAPAAVWALAAALLPWIRARRPPRGLNVVITFAWAAATATATAIVLDVVARRHGVVLPGEGVLGAVSCGFGALAPDARGDRHERDEPADADRELA
jgi:hypothetical protein